MDSSINAISENNIESDSIEASVEKLVSFLLNNGLTISTAESCTGGLLSATLVNVSGVSDVFKGGFVTYSNELKMSAIGVKSETLKKYGAVSSQVACEMAQGAKNAANADIAVSTTGIAGPGGGSIDKPVGTVYIGVSIKDNVSAKRFNFDGNRSEVRSQTVAAALNLLSDLLYI